MSDQCETCATIAHTCLCNVVRYVDALDEGASRVRIKYERDHHTGENLKFYSVSGVASLIFKPSVVGNAHGFRILKTGTSHAHQ